MSGTSRFDCFPSDFLNGVIGMSADQISAYTVILMLQYDRGGPVRYESREREIATRSGMPKGRLVSAVEKLLDLGKLSLENGCLVNARATAELAKIEEKRAKNRENSEKGGIATRGKFEKKVNDYSGDDRPTGGPTVGPKQGPIPSTPYPLPSKESSLRSDSPPETRLDLAPIEAPGLLPVERPASRGPADFDEFYAAYPKHENRKTASIRYETARRGKVSHERIMDGLQRWRAKWDADLTEKKFIPAPDVWLNKAKYDDEAVPNGRPARNVIPMTRNGKPSIQDAAEILREKFRKQRADADLLGGAGDRVRDDHVRMLPLG
jgi:uncharacterized protein YdaU (DUF1376 family)